MGTLVTGAMLVQLLVIKLQKAMESEGIYTNILYRAQKDLADTVKVLETLEAVSADVESENAAKTVDAPAPVTVN